MLCIILFKKFNFSEAGLTVACWGVTVAESETTADLAELVEAGAIAFLAALVALLLTTGFGVTVGSTTDGTAAFGVVTAAGVAGGAFCVGSTIVVGAMGSVVVDSSIGAGTTGSGAAYSEVVADTGEGVWYQPPLPCSGSAEIPGTGRTLAGRQSVRTSH